MIKDKEIVDFILYIYPKGCFGIACYQCNVNKGGELCDILINQSLNYARSLL